MPVISYSIVEDSGGSGDSWDTVTGTDGENNLDTNPQFEDWVDPAAPGWTHNSDGDYSLKTGSPAIDAGSNALYPADADDPVFAGITLSNEAKTAINAALEKDRGGNPRKNGTIDMGAYEQ